jgi:fatty-acyl-CoA synthase
MTPAHFAHWPPGLPRHLTVPQTHLFYNVEVSAARYPDKPFIVFYDTTISFAEFRQQAEPSPGIALNCGRAGDRIQPGRPAMVQATASARRCGRRRSAR